ncbi:RNA-binding protein [Solemya pervernicosa gill symbiont]|uniref:Heat shock protein 15 n=2 Tax=Gammaproteobacteria incertae sedis TaxID=118884 RepID=A0A1T2L7W9_9GAMM|nr:S4 domain-containing protein [Candidatus Reidiella endopervernicosa]OOZ41124.1 RNA-binding protein [Solemya pervernicosa gill symbiont]QKQ26293.1 RNA-binding protein [Candidatus Reidiella endopervernicosa]
MPEQDSKLRLDKWLWAARFFKTRRIAVEAIDGGKVHLNGARTKASRTVKVGDELSIHRGHEEYIVTIDGLAERRGPAKEAQLLYSEHEQSREKREREAEQRRLLASTMPPSDHRPDKRARRKIVRFTRRERK